MNQSTQGIMKIKNIISTIISIFFMSIWVPSQVQAQDTNPTVMQEIGLQFGWRFNRVTDQRFATNTKKISQPVYGMYYRKESERKREELKFSMSRTLGTKSPGLLSFKTIMPQVSYSHQRKVGNLWVGGFLDSFSLMNLPRSTTGFFTNNSISYTIVGSLGPMIGYEQNMRENDRNRLTLNTNARIGLLNYVVRPAFGHPYPEKYLTEENFSPTRSGMAGPLLKSGKLQTLNRYQMFRFVLGFNYYHRGRIKLGLQYEVYGQNNRGKNDRSRTLMQDLIFGASYLY